MAYFRERSFFSRRDLCVSREGRVINKVRQGREIGLFSDYLTYVSPYDGKLKRINGYFDSGNKGIKKALKYATSALDREYWEHFGSQELNLKILREKPKKFRRFRR